MEAFMEFFAGEDLVPLLVEWTVKIVLALVIYVVGKWVSTRVTGLVRKLLQARDVDPTLVNFLANIVYTVLLVAVIIAALDTLGLPVTSLLAVVGAAGLAVGLALKDSLGNFAAGVMLVLFRPFSKGDFVEAAGVSGTIDASLYASLQGLDAPLSLAPKMNDILGWDIDFSRDEAPA